MTTIIAAEGAFAWDTQTTWQHRAMNGRDKVFRNGPVIFGVSGLGRVANVLRFMQVPELKTFEPKFSTEAWITNELVPAMLRALKDVDVAEVNNGKANSESDIIVSVNGLTGYLSGNFSFIPDQRGIYGVGSGSPYALGALLSGASVKEAVEVAIQLDLYSGGEARSATVDELMGEE